MRRLIPAGLVLAVVAAVLVAVGAASAPAPSACVYPTGTMTQAKALAYERCRFDELSTQVDALATPAPTVTATATTTVTATATVTTTVTADPTPSPTPTPTPDPTPTPVATFPDASNTGPTGTLTAYTGPSNITTAGTVIENKTIGCIEVSASGVTIRNSVISCAGGAVQVDDRKGYLWAERLLLVDVEIDCQNVGGTGVTEGHFTLRRADIHHCENGLSINQNVTVEDSYIHDLFGGNDAHADGIQLSFGHWDGTTYPCCAKDVVIRHNTIYGVHADGSLGTSSIIMNPSADQDVLVENNLMAGGAATVYCNRPGSGNNVRLIDNRFSTLFSSKVGFWFASDDCADETLSGNVYHESGQPILLD